MTRGEGMAADHFFLIVNLFGFILNTAMDNPISRALNLAGAIYFGFRWIKEEQK